MSRSPLRRVLCAAKSEQNSSRRKWTLSPSPLQRHASQKADQEQRKFLLPPSTQAQSIQVGEIAHFAGTVPPSTGGGLHLFPVKILAVIF